MYSPQEIFEENLKKLNGRWKDFGSQEDSLDLELFNQLYKETIKTVVDVRKNKLSLLGYNIFLLLVSLVIDGS